MALEHIAGSEEAAHDLLGQELGLLGQYIELNPMFPVPSEARLTGFGVPVWAIIGYLQHAVNNDLSAAARDYDLPSMPR